MRLSVASAAASLILLSRSAAAFQRGNGILVGPEDSLDGIRAMRLVSNGTNGWGTFDQLLDHSDPSKGTFSQRYWYGTEFWKGPGSPIILVNPGEQTAENFNTTYTTTQRLPGLFAKEVGGAVVIMEHRYWGESSPYDNLTTENMQYLTLENSVKDNTYFAQNFKPPFDTSGRSCADEAPWVFSGGSYSGALAGWIAALDPGVFWAYHGTSGVVEAVGDFWRYFEPVQAATPQNCSSDLDATINYIDDILLNGEEDEKQELKDKFMLGDLQDADFAAAIEFGPWTWQSTQFYSESVNGFNEFYRFCDYVENVFPNSTAPVPGSEGVGQEKALEGYAKWIREIMLPGRCESAGYEEWQGTYNTGCFDALNADNIVYKDLTPGNWGNRQWNWMLCDAPFKWWQDGAPEGQPTMVSRLVTLEYWESLCPLWFPEGGYGIDKGLTEEDVNNYTGGWEVTSTTRLMYANGQYDPWLDATVSSSHRPGGPLESTPELPVRVIPGGVHCSDYYGQNWAVNEEIKQIADEQAANMKQWIAEYYDQ